MSELPPDDYAEGFDKWAEYYATTDEIELLRDNVQLENKSVLEIGCGSGRLTERLSPIAEEYYAIDIVPELVKFCNNKRYIDEDTDSIFLGSGEDIPFDDNTFDIVLDGWALTAQNQQQALAEYQRVVKPNGIIVIIAESWDEPDGRINSDYVRIIRKYDPEYDWYELIDELYIPIYDQFPDENITHYPLETEYQFPSRTAAFRAFEFHITQYHEREFPEERRVDMWRHIGAMCVGDDGPVQLSEHANFFFITPNK